MRQNIFGSKDPRTALHASPSLAIPPLAAVSLCLPLLTHFLHPFLYLKVRYLFDVIEECSHGIGVGGRCVSVR